MGRRARGSRKRSHCRRFGTAGTIASVDDRGGGERPVVQSPYRFSTAKSGARGASPQQGEHNADVLADWLGFDARTIESLRASGVLIER